MLEVRKQKEMGSFKWIAGFLGWVTWGPIGALLGFLAGSAIDGYIEMSHQLPGGDTDSQQTYSRSQQRTGTRGYTAAEQRNSFLVSLLVLSAAVIKADGRALQSELDYVKEFVRKNFGDAAVPQAMRMLEQFTRQDMNYSQRLQLFHYLVQIALADGEFHKREKSVLEAIGNTISLSNTDINSVISMFYKEVSAAYSVLGISSSATDDEVRTAYRKMAMKNHPDKVSTLGPDVQKAAAEKFRQVQEAYEEIKKERRLV